MVFSSLNFIFIFLPLFLFAYYVTPAAFRNSTLFAGSILFYAVGVIKQPYALFLLMVLTYLNYVFGIRLYQIHNPGKKRLFLTKVIFFDFLWLFLFKYSRHLSLPLGISFYTFQLKRVAMRGTWLKSDSGESVWQSVGKCWHDRI